MLSRIRRQQAQSRNPNTDGSGGGGVASAASGGFLAVLRLKKDLDNLDGICSKLEIPDPQNLFYMRVTVEPPRSSIWYGGSFQFSLEFRDSYPYEGPRVRYLGPYRVWHPNIEGDEFTVGVQSVEDGETTKGVVKKEWGVCLNFQTEWKPTLGLRDIIIMIELLFQVPNPDEPLHGTAKLAAQMMKNDLDAFRRKTRQWMRGNYVD